VNAGPGVLDTSAVILFDRLDIEELPEEPMITAVTLAELSVGPLVADDPAEQAARQARLQVVESSFDPLPFDAGSARAYGRVAAALRRSGRRPQARAFGALVAATAVANGLAVYTCNPRDFVGVDELVVVPVTHPEDVR